MCGHGAAEPDAAKWDGARWDGAAIGEPRWAAGINAIHTAGRGRSRIAGLFSALVSLVLLIVAGLQFRGMALGQIAGMIPRSSAFWFIFALYYLAGPVSEW